MKRKETAEEQVQRHARDIVREIAGWNYINKNGCNDPHWPDGENMNLVRNHVIYVKNQIHELCEKNGLKIPDEAYLPTPPEIDNCYMANLKQKERVDMLKRMGDKLTRGKNKYEADQLSLF